MTKKMRKKELLFVSLLFIFAVAFYFFYSARYVSASSATITLNGEVIRTVSLAENLILSLDEDPSVVFEVRDGGIAFIENNCPDLICVHRGFITANNPMAAACIPKGLLLYINDVTTGESDLDIIAG